MTAIGDKVILFSFKVGGSKNLVEPSDPLSAIVIVFVSSTS